MQTGRPSTGPAPQGDEVVGWRRHRLLDAGFSAALAAVLAADFRADLHAVLELVERGCPPVLAARILAPADEASGALR